ncbi:hypothetical protein [Piscinibacter terrae]|uniref:hypothetical protein n=1 Tax=Piscinibacter terrae TaxID=2496871 RepID=UPI000F5AA968|nr:hypothetical protein [Albitalea terrae]
MAVQISGSALDGLGRLPKNADNSYQYLLVRLLLGTATVCRGSIRAKQVTDYSSLPATVQNRTPAIAFKDFLVSYSLGGTVERFVKVTRGDNREFYKEILSEFLNFHLHAFQDKNTSAFVFLYRILERISYTVPLLYAATQTDYIGTFKDLKAILHADAEGELGLFKKFLGQGKFIDSIKLQVVQRISFSCSSGHGASYYDLTCEKFKSFASVDQAAQEVEIKFSEIPEFLKTIRNRFFHSRTGDGRGNITTISMPDSDEYFAKINPVIASFLAIIVLHTLSSKYHV